MTSLPLSHPVRAALPALAVLIALAGAACGPERLSPPAQQEGARPARGAVQGGPLRHLPATAYQVEWAPLQLPARLAPGSRLEVQFGFKNAGSETWPATGQGELYVVRLAHRWLRARDGQVVADYGNHRVELPAPLAPGQSVTLADTLQAPSQPGDYLVQVDLVHEGVAWFEQRGAAKRLLPIKVG